MNPCEKFRALLVLRPADLSLEEQQLVKSHLAACAACATLAQVYTKQDRLIRNAPRISLTPSQRSHLLSKIQQKRRQYTVMTKLSIILSAATAIVIFIAMGLGVGALITTGQPTPDTLPVQQIPVDEETPLTTPEITLALVWPIEGEFVSFAEEHSDTSQEVNVILGEHLGEQIKLLRFDVNQDAFSLDFTFYWQALVQPEKDYMVFVQVRNPISESVTQMAPVGGDYPTSQWKVGSIVKDEISIPLENFDRLEMESPEPGQYELVLGIDFDFATEHPRPIDSLENTIVLKSFELRKPYVNRAYSPDHPALDITAEEGTPVMAAAAGVVTIAEWDDVYGNNIVIDHGNGLHTRYAKLLDYQVEPGDEVAVGQRIGRVGSTATVFGPHLHFELLQNGEKINPLLFLPPQTSKKITNIETTYPELDSLLWPVKGRITQTYSDTHPALDIAAKEGTPVVAVAAGVVVFVGWDEVYGNNVVIDHGDGLRTFYSKLLDYQVEIGDGVNAGQRIGRVGSTGKATGPHLHFELRQHINPLPLLNDK